MKKRTRYEILATILEVLKRHPRGCRLTRLSYGAEIPNDRTRKFLDILISNGLVMPSIEDASLYLITERGEDFLETYYKMISFLDLFDDDHET